MGCTQHTGTTDDDGPKPHLNSRAKQANGKRRPGTGGRAKPDLTEVKCKQRTRPSTTKDRGRANQGPATECDQAHGEKTRENTTTTENNKTNTTTNTATEQQATAVQSGQWNELT